MKKYLLGFLLVFLISVLVTSQYEKYPHDSTTPSQNGGGAAVSPGNTPKTTDNPQQPQNDPPRWLRVSYQVFGWPNGITVWALFLTMMVVAEQTNQTRSAAEAARSGAISAKNASDSAMAGQRAYVATSCYWTVDKSRQANARFGVILRNVGHLPTVKMRNFIDYRIVEGELPENFVFPENAEPITSGTLLVPGDQVHGPHIPQENWISNADLLAVESENKNVYFFGWVKYFDGFPSTPERITRFCYSIRVTGNNEPPFVFHPYKYYNSAE